MEDECPICHETLPPSADASPGEAHVASCIESHLSNNGPQTHDVPARAGDPIIDAKAAPMQSEEDECPVCHTSLLSKEFDSNENAREAHISTCVELASSSAPEKASEKPPVYNKTARYDPPSEPHPDSKKASPLDRDVLTSSRSARPIATSSSSKLGASLQQQEDSKWRTPLYLRYITNTGSRGNKHSSTLVL